jgi:hypothetical protein
MVHSEAMEGVQPAAPPPEQIFTRVFRQLRPRTMLREVAFEFCHFANGRSTIRWEDGRLEARVADVFAAAPEDVQEALAWILLSKLFRKSVAPKHLDRYRRFINRKETVRQMEAVRRERGRKRIDRPEGKHYNLVEIFEELNGRFFFGLMARPEIGWSPSASRTILGFGTPCNRHQPDSGSATDTAVCSGVRDVPRDAALEIPGRAEGRKALHPHEGVSQSRG